MIPLMEEQGRADEEAALTLGASGLRCFLTITLPNIKWGLLYGVLPCNARAMGEFGAVSVVSGHIRSLANTLPLHVEILYKNTTFPPPSRLLRSSRSWPSSLWRSRRFSNGAKADALAAGRRH